MLMEEAPTLLVLAPLAAGVPTLFGIVTGAHVAPPAQRSSQTENIRASRSEIAFAFPHYCTMSIPPLMTTRGPFKHPSELRLADEDNGPIEPRKRPSRPVEYQSFYDRNRKKGKIGQQDARIENLPVLLDCRTKKECRCDVLTGSTVYQQRLRKLYCETVKGTNHDGGTMLLLTFMMRQVENKKARYNKFRYRKIVVGTILQCVWCRADPEVALLSTLNKHKWNVKTCPNYLKSEHYLNEESSWTFKYQVPLLRDGGGSSSPIDICLNTFKGLFGISPCRMDRVRNKKR